MQIGTCITVALVGLTTSIISGCGAPSRPVPTPVPSDLDRLTSLMTGTFSSEAQSMEDERFFHIRLVMAPMWAERDGTWLYVEQAAAGSLDAPYRQRLYHLIELRNGEFRSDVYTIGDADRFIGAWRTSGLLDSIDPNSIVLRDGCSIYLRPGADGSFVGSTREGTCPSSLRGASFATSEVTIRDDVLISWDRGWDADGTQVWGAEVGGYIFDHLSDHPPR